MYLEHLVIFRYQYYVSAFTNNTGRVDSACMPKTHGKPVERPGSGAELWLLLLRLHKQLVRGSLLPFQVDAPPQFSIIFAKFVDK